MAKTGIIIGVIVVLIAIAAIGYFSIAKSGVELDEESPLDRPQVVEEGEINDDFDSMTDNELEEFFDAVGEVEDKELVMDDSMDTGVELLAEGDFMRRVHAVEGRALLIQDGDKKTLRFEDFETDNGPNLHIYLSSELGDEDFIDLGEIKATKGNVNYDIPPGTDLEKYNKVLVWCVPFRVLFSYAELE